jgi:hypothetical protein
MKIGKFIILIICLILTISACGTKPLYLVKQNDNMPAADTIHKCLAVAKSEMKYGGVANSQEETLLLRGIETERFLWWGSLSGPRANVNSSGLPGEHQSLIPTTDPYKIHFAERYVLCLLRNGYAWPDEEWVKERFNKIKPLELPMYGQSEFAISASLKKENEKFIAQTTSEHGGDRKAASDDYYHQGLKYMKEGNFDYAMRRYNQAWLLNPDGYRPYWGFACIITAQRKYDEAFKYFEKARQMINDKYQEAALVLDMAIAYSNRAHNTNDNPQEQARYFDLAIQKCKESTDIDPTFIAPWELWAILLYDYGKYDEAWQKIKKIKALGGKVPEDFLNKLRGKMPEPE